MTIRIYDFSGTPHPYTPKPDEFYVKHAYDGVDTLSFRCQASDEIFQYIQNEAEVETEDNLYLIKNIDDRGGIIYVDCTVDLDDWKSRVFFNYRKTNTAITSAITSIKPSTWTYTFQVSSTVLSKRTTIEEMEDTPFTMVTPLEILAKIGEIYGVTFRFDAKKKKVYIIEPEYYSGLTTGNPAKYFSDELNLRSLGFTGNSDEFATRLYARGAVDENGIAVTFEDINDGKDYVEDFTYCNKVVCMGWSDERYSVKENLLAAAKAKLAEVCNPVRSYECDVINLDNDMELFKAVILMDRKRQLRVKHLCVEYVEYPAAHHLDVCTLATVAPDIRDKWNNYLSQALQKTEGAQKTTTTTLTSAFEASLKEATELITGNGGGYKVEILNAQGKPQETLYMDTDDISTAKYVIRINKSGIGFSSNGVNGPFSSAWTIKGVFDCSQINVQNLSADSIVTGKIEDVKKNNYWDLVTGEFVTKYGQIGDFTLSGGSLYYGNQSYISGMGGSALDAIHLGRVGLFLVGTTKTTKSGVTYTEKYGTSVQSQGIVFYDNADKTVSLAQIRPYRAGSIADNDSIIFNIRNSAHSYVTTIAEFDGGDDPKVLFNAKLRAGKSGAQNQITGPLHVLGNFSVNGTKNRVIKTDNYGEKLFYAYETASPLFGDVGEGIISELGTARIYLDPVLVEGISTSGYQVFLQLYGEGAAYVSERQPGYFEVTGTPNLKFGWELKAKQKGYENARLEPMEQDSPVKEENYGDLAEAYFINNRPDDYGLMAADYLQTLTFGRITT